MNKTIAEWEHELNVMFLDTTDIDLSASVDEAGFNELRRSHQVVNLLHGNRKEFLQANGYEATRENMVNAALPARPPKA